MLWLESETPFTGWYVQCIFPAGCAILFQGVLEPVEGKAWQGWDGHWVKLWKVWTYPLWFLVRCDVKAPHPIFPSLWTLPCLSHQKWTFQNVSPNNLLSKLSCYTNASWYRKLVPGAGCLLQWNLTTPLRTFTGSICHNLEVEARKPQHAESRVWWVICRDANRSWSLRISDETLQSRLLTSQMWAEGRSVPVLPISWKTCAA